MNDTLRAASSRAEPATLPVAALSRRIDTEDSVEHGTEREVIPMQSRQGFCIDDLGVMIRDDEGTELADMVPIFHLPNAPAWLVGVANLHGLPMPVVDLGIFFGLPMFKSRGTARLLVLGRGADAVAIRIDGLPMRVRWNVAQRIGVESAPPAVVPVLRGACQVDGWTWFDLDVPHLLQVLETALSS